MSNESDIDLLYKQFYSGMDRNLTQAEKEAINKIATSEVSQIFTLKVYKILDIF